MELSEWLGIAVVVKVTGVINHGVFGLIANYHSDQSYSEALSQSFF